MDQRNPSSSRPEDGHGDPTPDRASAREERVLAALRDGQVEKTPAYLAWVEAHAALKAAVGESRAKAAEEVYDAVWEFIVAVEDGETRSARVLRDAVVCELDAADVYGSDLEERYLVALDALEDERAEVGRRQRAAAAVAVAMVEPSLSDRLDRVEEQADAVGELVEEIRQLVDRLPRIEYVRRYLDAARDAIDAADNEAEGSVQ